MPKHFYVGATGTDAGKTFFTRHWAEFMRGENRDIGALKPLETGCNPIPQDAAKLALACGHPELVHFEGFYRARPALGPFAIEEPKLNLAQHKNVILDAASRFEYALIESAGGVAVPLDERRTNADLARELGLGVVLIAPDELGVQSYVLSSLSHLREKGATSVIIALNQRTHDQSTGSNADVISRCVDVPVVTFSEQRLKEDDFWRGFEDTIDVA